MLRVHSRFLGVLVTALSLAPAAAEELAKADAAPAITAQATESKPAASAQDLYPVCAFYPKPGTSEEVYRQAMRDNSISAEAVRAEYTGYARYLYGAAALTEADRQFLRNNGIRVPEDLNPANQAGLHNVINDASLSADARRVAVNNFLSRAVEAELYCGFNSCGTSNERGAGASTVSLD
jgi:hypothetical protein